ncbi:MAG TPA: sulfatase-like hydrolase/transferase [Verrucomicrobiota bacterium]|nr:sulfatase-like hydrolase/transferase [Verrucomicrobiota bacterium]
MSKLIIWLGLLAAFEGRAQNLIVNGGFESRVVGWEGTYGVYHDSQNPLDGTQVGYLIDIGHSSVGKTLTQTVPTEPGSTYTITFSLRLPELFDNGDGHWYPVVGDMRGITNRTTVSVRWGSQTLTNIPVTLRDRWTRHTLQVVAQEYRTPLNIHNPSREAWPFIDRISVTPSPRTLTSTKPNVLFIILDDIGIDQLKIFNPLARNPAPTPNLDAIAEAGVKFTRCYAMPECSPGRSCFFTGRYPLRTGVTAAILSLDLTGAQVSRYEMTTPRILATAGYRNALIGKFHLAGPDNNPDGFGTPATLGWNYFNGTLYGAPAYIDPSLGGQYTADTTNYCWGFPLGSQRGVGWFLTSSNTVVCDDNQGLRYTGKEIVTRGGIPALNADGHFATTCAEARSSGRSVAFNQYNGYYMWPKATNDGTNVVTSIGRQYATIAQTDDSVAWIRQQSNGVPWMCSVSYSAIHTPYQPPPDALYPPGFTWPTNIPENDCQNAGTIKVVGDLMLSAMDREIGRLLVESGLATRGPNGQLIYDPAASNTMIVITGDNGTYLDSVNYPYNPARAKGTPYETGIRTPLIVSGPLVTQPGRSVDHPVSAVDLFQLFGELAGVDVRSVVPSAHVLDCRPMLPYLTDPNTPAIRRFIFAQAGNGLKAPSSHIWPTVITVGPDHICTDSTFTSQSLAETEGGTWYGPGGTQQFFTCCDVDAANLYTNLTILPTRSWAVRNERYKLIQFDRAPCDTNLGQFELYDLQPTPTDPINPLGLDNSGRNLLINDSIDNLTPTQLANYFELMGELQRIQASETTCYTDGNLDKQVTQADVDGVNEYWGQPSWFDVNSDGTTDQTDLDCVMANLGNNCLESGAGTICPTPPYINSLALLSDGATQFIFTGVADTAYTVFATTNLLQANSEWLNLGPATPTGTGYFEFTDAPSINQMPRLYQVQAP